MRIVLMATGPFALPTMRWLIDAPHELLCWVTRPPRPAGRGGRVTQQSSSCGASISQRMVGKAKGPVAIRTMRIGAPGADPSFMA